MRIALISICETCDYAIYQPRALLPIADGTLAHYQIRLAIDAGAQKIIAFVQVVAGQVMRLQEYTEKAGADFVLVRGISEIASHVAAEDDVLVIADGLYAHADVVASVWNADIPNFGVFSAGQDTGQLAGFERIDINHHWAGLAKLKGRDLLALASLPGDWSMESAALRSAVQQQYRRIMIGDKLLSDGDIAVQSGAHTIALAQEKAVFSGQGARFSRVERNLLDPIAKLLAPLIWRREKSRLLLQTIQLAGTIVAPIAAYFLHAAAGFALLLIALFANFLAKRLFALFAARETADYLKYLRLFCALAILQIGLMGQSPGLQLYIMVYLSIQTIGLYALAVREKREAAGFLQSVLLDPYVLLLTGFTASVFNYLTFACLIAGLLILAQFFFGKIKTTQMR